MANDKEEKTNKLLIGLGVVFIIAAVLLMIVAGVFLLKDRQESGGEPTAVPPTPELATPTPIPPANTPTPLPLPTNTPQIEQPTQPANPLANTAWTLINFGDPTLGLAPGTIITAEFGPDTITGSAGCNDYNGNYTISGSKLSVGALTSTRQACDELVMQQEQNYLTALEDVRTYLIVGKLLYVSYVSSFGPGTLVYGPPGTPPNYVIPPETGPTTRTETISGNITPGQARQSFINAEVGETLAITITSANNTAVFSVSGQSDHVIYAREVTNWSATLTVTQDYLVTVTSTAAEGSEAVSYEMIVSLTSGG